MNMFTRKPLPVPVMTAAAGTTKAVTRFHLRHIILRANVSARTTAEWAGQMVTEKVHCRFANTEI